ncbi:MAG TPA: hypothetical protein DCX22_01130, partial [Dehalococcoidia bacterium]|nr:hypothetical protein [Dehalococcoidia bacterium]
MDIQATPMNSHTIIPLVAATAYLPLLALLYVNRPWQQKHKLLFLYLIGAALWSFGDIFFRSNLFMEDKVLLGKIILCILFWAGTQLHYFMKYIYSPVETTKKIPFAYIAMILSWAIIIAFLPESVSTVNGVTPSYGFWLIPPSASLVYFLCRDLVLLSRRYRQLTDPIKRSQILYIIIGAAIIVSFTLSSFSQFGREFPLAHIGNVLNASILTYTILKHRLLDLKFVLQQGLVWIISAALFVGFYLFIFFLLHLVANYNLDSTTLALTALAAITVAGIVFMLRQTFMKLSAKFSIRETYPERQALQDFIKRRIHGIFTLSDLGKELLGLLTKVLQAQRTFLLLSESASNDFVIRFAEPKGEGSQALRIKQDSPIVTWLNKENKYLSREDLDIRPEFLGLRKNEAEASRSLGIELFFPIISRDNLIGILALGRKNSGKYSMDDINITESTINQVAMSLEKQFLQEQLREQQKELSLINRLASVMTSSLNIQDVYDAFVTGLREMVSVDFAVIALREEQEICITAVPSKNNQIWELNQRIPLKNTAIEWLIKHKKTLVEPDLSHDSMFITGKQYLEKGLRSIVYLPLLVKNEPIGCLIVASNEADAYTPKQVSLLERLASQIATSVENSRLYSRAEQRSRIDELTHLFNRRHFDETIKQEIDRHTRYGNTLSVLFLDLDNFKNYNDRLGHLEGDKLLAMLGQLIKDIMRTVDIAFRYGGDEFAVIMPHTTADDAFAVAERIRGKIYSTMARKKINITASIGLATWPEDGITRDEMVTACDSALYYAKRTGANRTCIVSKMMPTFPTETTIIGNVEKETLNTIYALAATLEARDQYTYGHSKKVSNYAVALAEALGLPSEKVAIVSAAALLHDIGKIGILDDVLRKSGKLTKEDWDLIKSHPTLSRSIVAHIPSL